MRTFPSCLLFFLLSIYFQGYCNLEYFVPISSLIHLWYIIVSQKHGSSLKVSFHYRPQIKKKKRILIVFRTREGYILTQQRMLKGRSDQPVKLRKFSVFHRWEISAGLALESIVIVAGIIQFKQLVFNSLCQYTPKQLLASASLVNIISGLINIYHYLLPLR